MTGVRYPGSEGWVIQCLGLGRKGIPLQPGAPDPAWQFVAAWDVDELNPAGEYGVVAWTPDPAAAKRYPTREAAVAAYTATPKARPVKGDGNENCPLMAYVVLFMEAARARPGP